MRRLGNLLFALAVLAGTGPARAGTGAAGDLSVRLDSLTRQEDYLRAMAVSADRLDALLADPGADPDEVNRELDRLGSTCLRCGENLIADAVFGLVLDRARALYGDDDPRIIPALLRHATMIRRFSYGSPVSAYSVINDAQCLAGGTNGAAYMPSVLRAEANWYRSYDLPRSAECYRQAVEWLAASPGTPRFELVDARAWYGWTLLHLGQHARARELLEEARGELTRMGLEGHSLMGTIVSALADLHAIDGDWRAAEQGYRRGTAIFEATRRRRGELTTDLPLHGYNLLALTQLHQGRGREAWESFERYQGQVSGRALAISRRGDRARQEHARIEGLRRELGADHTLDRVRDQSPGLSPDTWRALTDYVRKTSRLRADESAQVEAALPAPSVADLQACLGASQVYIGWLNASVGNDLSVSSGPTRREAWLFMIRRSGPVRWVPVFTTDAGDADAATRLVDRYSDRMDRASAWRQHLGADPELREQAARVREVILADALDDLPDGTSIVAEFPRFGNATLALECLVGADDRYLVDRFDFVYAPSAIVFEMLVRDAPAAAGPSSLLAVGDPVFDPSDTTTVFDSRVEVSQLRAAVSGDAEALSHLPRLPFAAIELDSVSAHFAHADVLRRDDATESALDAISADGRLGGYGVIHIATHALADAMYQRSAIALSRTDVVEGRDGLVSLSEIAMGWKLNAGIVTLSCCQGTGIRWFRGDRLGFPTALLAAGAHNVVASQWKVDDRVTSMFMARFYALLMRSDGAGYRMPPPVALAKTRVWMRDYRAADGSQPYRHPLYWSGFTLVGCGR